MERRPRANLGALLAILLAIAALYFGRPLLMPLALALLVTFLLAPLVTRLEAIGLGRTLSVVVMLVMLAATAGGLGWVAAREAAELADDLPQYRTNLRAKIRDLRGPLGSLSGAAEEINQLGDAIDQQRRRRPAAGRGRRGAGHAREDRRAAVAGRDPARHRGPRGRARALHAARARGAARPHALVDRRAGSDAHHERRRRRHAAGEPLPRHAVAALRHPRAGGGHRARRDRRSGRRAVGSALDGAALPALLRALDRSRGSDPAGARRLPRLDACR